MFVVRHKPHLLTRASILFFVLALGCTSESKPIVRTSQQETPSLTPFLEIRLLRIHQGEQIKTVLYQNGLLEERGEPLGQIQKDGRFVDLLGNVLVTMSSDGRIDLPHGEIRIDPDGTTWTQLDASRRDELRIERNGKVIGSHQNVLIEGLGPDGRRLAAYVFILPDILRLQKASEVH